MLGLRVSVHSKKLFLNLVLALIAFRVVADDTGEPTSREPCGRAFSRSTSRGYSWVLPKLQPVSADKMRTLSGLRKLRVMNFNMLDLRIPEKAWVVNAETFPTIFEKSLVEKTNEILLKGVTIRDANPDIFVAEEVMGGLSTAQEFNRLYLQDSYRAFGFPSNDEQQRNIVFNVKKDLPLLIEARTYTDRTRIEENGKRCAVFKRDFPAIVLRDAGLGPNSDPLLIVFGMHAKSARPAPGDPDGSLWRANEYREAVKIVAETEREFPHVPIIIAGDFNASVESPELNVFRDAGLRSNFDMLFDKPAEQDKITHTFHPTIHTPDGRHVEGAMVPKQLDAIWMYQEYFHLVQNSYVYRFRDHEGEVKPIPQRFGQRRWNPSDHFPVIEDLDFNLMYRMSHPN